MTPRLRTAHAAVLAAALFSSLGLQPAAAQTAGSVSHTPAGSSPDAGFISSAKQSVVTITAYSREDDLRQVRVGTGFIYHESGFVISMRSVVKNSDEVIITLPDNTMVPGKVLDFQSRYGLVLIKIEGTDHVPLRHGRSSQLTRMSIMTVIGNSLGVFPSITLASFLGREQNGFIDLGAIIPPGNCGSPVLDQEGGLAGIIIGRVYGNPDSPVSQGKIGVAIPIELICREVDEMISYFNARRGWIGMTVSNIPGSDYVRITDIIENGPSDQAGLAVGDTIIMYEGRGIRGASDLKEKVIRNAPGTTISFTLKKGPMHISHLVHVYEEFPLK
ncbi:trypsin-like peptidase domain-containing protein [bacterium]|nr:trypsin-like peptidase domain-containing protein [bacterium]